MDSTVERIMKFFEGRQGIEPDTELFGSGYVNSLFALEIVLFVEKEVGIKLSRREITRENFSTVRRIAQVVESHGERV